MMHKLVIFFTFQEIYMYDSAGKEIFSELVQKFVSCLLISLFSLAGVGVGL